jgi:hypothetical protein
MEIAIVFVNIISSTAKPNHPCPIGFVYLQTSYNHLQFTLNTEHKHTTSLLSPSQILPLPFSQTPEFAMEALQSLYLSSSPLNPLHQKSHNATKPPRERISFIKASSSSTVSAPKREKDPKKRVVITGMGLVSVFGNDVDAYYDKLLAGESGIGTIDRFDASKFPTRFAGQIRGFNAQGYIDGKNDRRLDNCLRYCIVAGKKALEDADLGGNNLSKVFP